MAVISLLLAMCLILCTLYFLLIASFFFAIIWNSGFCGNASFCSGCPLLSIVRVFVCVSASLSLPLFYSCVICGDSSMWVCVCVCVCVFCLWVCVCVCVVGRRGKNTRESEGEGNG